MDPEFIQHRWMLGSSLGSSSSVRDYLLNSPFPTLSLLIPCSEFQDAHASCIVGYTCFVTLFHIVFYNIDGANSLSNGGEMGRMNFRCIVM